MSQTVHYDPCSGCLGRGMRPVAAFSQPPTQFVNIQQPQIVETCPLCNGTGKGKIREITEP